VMPFSASVLGEYGHLQAGATLYAANILLFSVVGYFHLSYLLQHPELQEPKISPSTAQAMRVRVLGSIAVAAVVIIVAFWAPRQSALAYALMVPVFKWSRTLQLRGERPATG